MTEPVARRCAESSYARAEWPALLHERVESIRVAPRPRVNGSVADGTAIYIRRSSVYTRHVAKHLVDIDEQALSAARAELGTNTIRDTVNEALNLAAGARSTEVKRALDRLARLELDDRDNAWR